MSREPRRVIHALLLGAMLGACDVPPEWSAPPEPAAPEVLGSVRAPVTLVEPETLSQTLLTDTARVFPANQLPLNGDSAFSDNQDPNLLVQQNNSEVYVTYVSTSAEFNNALAYFTYPDGSPPTTAPALTQANVVFTSAQGLTAGARVSLGTFSAGTRIGLVLLPGAGTSGQPSLSGTRYYSLAGLNAGSTYFSSKYHNAEQRRLIGIEDMPASSSAYDFNDLIVSVSSLPREKPRRMTVCKYTFTDSSTDWRYHDWVPSDCSAGLPAPGSYTLGSGFNSSLDSRQQVDCQITRGGHYLRPSGSGYNGQAVPVTPASRTVTCAYVIPAESLPEIRYCSFKYNTAYSASTVSRPWQYGDCNVPRMDDAYGGYPFGMGLNGVNTSGQHNCSSTAGNHYNHASVDGPATSEIRCLYVKPSPSTSNITLCKSAFTSNATGSRRYTWQARDCSNGLPKPGAWSLAEFTNGNGTRGMLRCDESGAEHTNHPDINGSTTARFSCLYVNP